MDRSGDCCKDANPGGMGCHGAHKVGSEPIGMPLIDSNTNTHTHIPLTEGPCFLLRIQQHTLHAAPLPQSSGAQPSDPSAGDSVRKGPSEVLGTKILRGREIGQFVTATGLGQSPVS